MSQCVKEEVAWEAECVDALWAALFAGHGRGVTPELGLGPETVQAQDFALPVAQGHIDDTGSPHLKKESTLDPEDVPSTQCSLGDLSASTTAKTKDTLAPKDTHNPHVSIEDSSVSKTPKTEVLRDSQNITTTASSLEGHNITNTAKIYSILNATDVPSSPTSVEDHSPSKIVKTELERHPGEASTSVEDAIASETAQTDAVSEISSVPATGDIEATRNVEDLCSNFVDSASDTAETIVDPGEDSDNDFSTHFSVEDSSDIIPPNIEGIYGPGNRTNNLEESSIIKTVTTEVGKPPGEVSNSLEDSTLKEPSFPKNAAPISTKPCYVKLERKILKNGFVCQICKWISGYRHNLMSHILTHTQAEIATIKVEKKIVKKGNVNCHICGKSLTRHSLPRHLRLQKCDPLKEQMRRKITDDSITKICYTCDLCGMTTYQKNILLKHMKIHARETSICKICDRRFKAAWELINHMKSGCKPEKKKEKSKRNRKPRSVESVLEDIVLKSCYVKLERIRNDNETTAIINEAMPSCSESEDLFDEDELPFETGEETYYCGLCEKQFDTLSSLGDHVCDPKKLSCTTCKKRFKHQFALDEHLRIHTGEKPFTCDECKKQFRLKNSIKRHIQTMHGTQHLSYSCKFCKVKFRSDSSLRKHLRTHMVEKVKKLYSCKICKKRFKYSRECEEHERVHSGEKPFQCTFCLKGFRLPSYLRDHIRTHTKDNPYTCEVCNRSFRVRQLLNYHKRVHTNERPFACDVCNKRFKRPDTLNIHKRTHTSDKPYVCEFCSKRFTQRGHLKGHRRVHTGEKPFSCTVCHRRFAESHQLKNHGLVHSKERPHSCNICQKKFKDTPTLRIHQRIHTGEKPFECKICGKVCSQSSNLKTHMRTHGKKSWPFSCNICEKKFQRRLYLDRHLARHDEQTHMCDVCGARFRSSEVLSVHARSHYGGE